jgi:multidrug efflux system membrane fusion protein
VPAEAVQQGSEGLFVFAIRDGVAEVRKVKVTTVQKGIAVIAEGLAGGDTVVKEGQLRLTPGAKVKAAEAGGAKP